MPFFSQHQPRFSGGLEELACDGAALLAGALTDGATSAGTDMLVGGLASRVAQTAFPDVGSVEDLNTDTLCWAAGKVSAAWLTKLVPGATQDGMANVLATSLEAVGKLYPDITPLDKQAVKTVASRAMAVLYGNTKPFGYVPAQTLSEESGKKANQAIFQAHWRLFHLLGEAAKKPPEARSAFLNTFIRKDYPGSKSDQYASLLVKHALGAEHELTIADSPHVKAWFRQHNHHQQASRAVIAFWPKLIGFAATALGGPEAWLGAAGVLLAKRLFFPKKPNPKTAGPLPA